jgi:hypothetical protein
VDKADKTFGLWETGAVNKPQAPLEGAQEPTEAPEEEPRRGFFSRLFGG